jgi:hypothetical protein
MKFRKKPIIVEAVKFVETGRRPCLYGEAAQYNCEEVCHFVGRFLRLACEPNGTPNGRIFLEIPTLEGVMQANVGDWIIKGVKGEFYSCKPDVFAATYEPVQDAEPLPALNYLNDIAALKETDQREEQLTTL